jgi:rhodanese-related sulfurtransferase
MTTNTKTKLSDYILRRLGSPVNDIELTPEQIEDIIYATIRKYSEYAIDGMEERLFIIPMDPGISQYRLDESISSVIDIRTASSYSPFSIPGGYVLTNSYNFVGFQAAGGAMSLGDIQMLSAQFQMIQDYFNIPVRYTYNPNNNKLVFMDDCYIRNKQILLYCWTLYKPEDVDGIFNHPWIKDMCVAEARIQWANNIGKFNAPLLGGATLNYSDIMSQGQTDVDRLNQELLDRWSAPLGITAG